MTKITTALYVTVQLTAVVLAAYTNYDLYKAAKAGELDTVNSALAAGVNPDTYRDYAGYTALHEAAWYNHTAVVKALLAAGANINPQDNSGSTPISYASWWGYAEVVTLLAGSGADFNLPDKGGDTPIMKATRYGHHSTVLALIRAQANIALTDDGGDTALHWAAKYNRPEIAQMLLHAGSSITILNNAGQTPGDAARFGGNYNLGDMIDDFTSITKTIPVNTSTTDQSSISTPSGLQIAGITCGVSLLLIIICSLMKYWFDRTQADTIPLINIY